MNAIAITVALVDDFRLVVEGLDARLADKRLGVKVVIRANSWSELIESPHFPAHVTVLDLHLGDTISIGAKIQALLSAGSEVVVISRHADPAAVTRAMKAGALGFVPKTEGVDELVAAIEAASRGQRHLPGPLESLIDATHLQPTPNLGRQELRALAMYSRGGSIREIAVEMQTTDETVKSYVKRARRKYRDVGVDLGTRGQLRKHGISEGWLDPE